MKKTDLRIGNYIELYYKKENYKKIVQMGFFEFHELGKNNIEINPIKLTEQWLKDFGFITKNGQDWFIPGNGVYKFLVEGAYIYYPSHTPGINTRVEYIHQLQNLFFALTSEELKKKS